MNASSARAEKIRENYRQVLEEVEGAVSAAGRPPDSVRVVAVTKYVGVPEALALVEAGCLDLGESRPQSLWDKAPRLPATVRWHLIGHLQRNKVERTLPLVHLMHSLDSMRLTDAIAGEAGRIDAPIAVLLEVHIAQDSSKTGMRPEEARDWLERYVSDALLRQRIELRGLMGMSSLDADASQVHREFASLRNQMQTWNEELGLQMTELSMGMSQDFAIAIAEGSTIVRIGSRLFEGLPQADTPR